MLLLAGALLLSVTARAQFYQIGNDPSGLRWRQTETPSYRIIYPQGADSLARRYGRLLEQFRVPVGRSIGLTPGEGQRRKMPVILRTHNPYPNGMVLWAPRRMELFTLPDAYDADPVPWDIQLSSHEPRHQAQLQAAMQGWMKPLGWLAGQAWAPVGWFLYMERPFGEGDAVAVETGVTSGTRARTDNFLNYYRMALDQGQERNWFQWRHGSFKRSTPDVYTLGYLSMAGARRITGNPLVARQMWELAYRRPWLPAPYNWSRIMGKGVNASFRDVLDLFRQDWQADAAARAPFMPMERLTAQERFPVEYSAPVILDGRFYLVRKGFVHNPELGVLQDGRFRALRPFASHASAPQSDENTGRLYWSETVRDPRWELAGSSLVRYLDTRSGRVRDLTGRGRRYYNPYPSPDGSRVSVVEYPFEGGSALVVLDAGSGAVLARYPAPEGLQLTESVWLDGLHYAIGVERGGFGLYRLDPADGRWAVELAPAVQKVNTLDSDGEALQWVSDRDGSNQLYRYYPAGKRLEQITSARYGASEFDRDSAWLYAVAPTLDGAALFRTPQDSLSVKEVSYSQVHKYQTEDILTAQEQALGPAPDLTAEVPFSAPEPFRKTWQGMRLHTWLPAYVDADAVRDGSFDFDYTTGALGATAFFQNDLGTLSGQLGYAFHQDPDTHTNWRSALHAKLTWTGWWPVVEASADFGDHLARRYVLANMEDVPAGESRWYSRMSLQDVPQLSLWVRAYVPLVFNKGGVLRGITPQVQYSFSNSIYQQATVFLRKEAYLEGYPAFYQLVDIRDGQPRLLRRMSASLRGYVMLPRADSQTYPRWGVGAELGGAFRPGLTGVFTPGLYAYAYAYLPGILREQGLRVSALVQHQLGGVIGDPVVNTVPQGFLGTVGQELALSQPTQAKFTARYAVPLYFGDLALGGVAYIKNFLLSPHADYSVFRDGNLWSAGADLTAELGRLLFVSFDTSVGVSFSWLGGSWYPQSGQTRPWYVGFIFNVEI